MLKLRGKGEFMKAASFALSTLVALFLFSTLAVAQVPHSDHVVIITLENHSYEQVIGNPDMPYYNQLAGQYSIANSYYATQHNSVAALMWLTTGAQVTTNNTTLENFNVDHIAREVWQSGKTWKAYLENLPSIGFTGYAVSGPYMKRHAPFAYFTDVVNSNQKLNLVPLDPFLGDDIAANALPNFSYIVPDANEDAHDGTLAEADLWLQTHIPQLLATPAFQKDGLLFIVWDEGNLSPIDNRETGGRVATLVIGPKVKRGFSSSVFYTHQDLLRTICDAVGLATCPGNGATGTSMTDFFPPSSTLPHLKLSAPNGSNTAVRNPTRVVADIVSDKPASAMIAYVDGKEVYRTTGGHTDFKADFSAGIHKLIINGWDSAGRLMQSVSTLNVIDHGVSGNACVVNQAGPSVTICSAANGASVTNPVRIVVETRDHDAEVLRISVLDGSRELYLDYGNRVDTDLTLSPGSHHIVVHAEDVNGIAFESAADINVTALTPVAAPPAPSIIVGVPLDGSSSSSPVHIAASLNSAHPATAMVVYSDGNEVFRTYSGSMDAYLDLKSGLHDITINAWDSSGALTQSRGQVRVPERIESCNEYKAAKSVTICSPLTTNAAAGVPFHLAAAARSDAGTIATMIVYADGREVFRTYSNYADAQLNLATGTHQLVVNAWDSAGTLLHAAQTITMK